MTDNEREARYVEHILRCIDRLEKLVADPDTERDFDTDWKIQNIVLRELQTMSESTQKLSEDLRRRHPGIDWREIGRFRNILVHNYLGEIEGRIVFNVIANDLGPLKLAMQSYSESRS